MFLIKVAIIGAGTAGLSCAIELEKHGIYPEIFEQHNFIGEYNPHVSAFLGFITRPFSDPVKYINQELGIKLVPLNQLQKVIHFSPNNEVSVSMEKSNFFIRGKEKNSVKNQLYDQIKSSVHLNSFVQPEELEKDFDYVVVADGHWAVPTRYGIWQEVMRTWLKGGIFEGDFDKNTLFMWLDNNLTRGVYSYLAPYNDNRAVIAHIIQDIDRSELNTYWDRFLESHDILKKYNLIETWELPHRSGAVTTHKVGKTYFIGAAGGGAEPFLGFGQFNAIYSGVMAGKSIANGTDINVLLKDITKKTKQLIDIRPVMTTATNKGFDKFLKFMKTPGLRSLVYKTNIDVIKYASFSIKIGSIINKKWVLKPKKGGH